MVIARDVNTLLRSITGAHSTCVLYFDVLVSNRNLECGWSITFFGIGHFRSIFSRLSNVNTFLSTDVILRNDLR